LTQTQQGRAPFTRSVQLAKLTTRHIQYFKSIFTPCTGLMGGWDQEDGFEEVPLDHPAATAPTPAGNSSNRIGGGGGEAARLRKQVAELQAGLEAAEAVSGCNA
jgi:hypothetical protein